MSFLLKKKSHILYRMWELNFKYSNSKKECLCVPVWWQLWCFVKLGSKYLGSKTIGTAYSFTFNNFVMILTCHVTSKIMTFPQNQVVLGSSWGSWPRCLPLHKANGCLVTPGGCQQRSTACWWPLRFCVLFL